MAAHIYSMYWKMGHHVRLKQFSGYPLRTVMTTMTQRHFSDGQITGEESAKVRRRVSILGGGSWGTAIAKVIGNNTRQNPAFQDEVFLYVRDDGLRLVIEKTRENIRYLPKVKLPNNVRATSSLAAAVQEADILVFAVPCEYLHSLCHEINEAVLGGSPRNPIGISLTKGFLLDRKKELERPSETIQRMTGIPIGVLSGANVASDVGREEFCEATLGPPLPLHPPKLPASLTVTSEDESEEDIKSRALGIRAHQLALLLSLFQADYYSISICWDTITVEMCGALVNVISCGAGLVDGLNMGINTKVAAMRCGLKEAMKFVALHHPDYEISTFLENCGIADLIASSFAGRNQRVASELVRSPDKSIGELETSVFGTQRPQGPNTAKVVFHVLERAGLESDFPFLVSVHRILTRQAHPKSLIDAIKKSTETS